MKSHPIADLFPMMADAEFSDFRADIKAKGLHDSIVTLDGMILDGRNRFRACELEGIEPKFEAYTGDDPVAFVVSRNLHRRHLTTSQRAMIAADMVNLSHGQKKPKAPTKREEYQHDAQICASDSTVSEPVSQPEAAEKMRVSRRIVQAAAKVESEGGEKLAQEVRQGNKTVHAAVKEVEAKAEEQIPTTAPIDDFDLPIPESLRELFAFAEDKFGLANTLIRKLEAVVDEIAKHDAGLFFKRNLQPNHVAGKDSFRFTPLRDLKAWLKLERPVMAICPYCHNTKPKGKPDPKCNGCKGKGFATASILKSCPQDYVDAAKEHLKGGDA